MKALFTALLFTAIASAQYTVGVIGPQTAYAGDTIYLRVQAGGTITGTPRLYIAATPPSGWTATWICNNTMEGCYIAGTRSYIWGGVAPAILKLKIPAEAVGAFTVPMNFEMNTVPLAKAWTVTVAPRPGDPHYAPPLDTTKWKSNMLTLAAKWCQTGTVLAFGTETQVWYYDGARVYFQIADYTKDPKWIDCALWISRQYRDYVVANNGGVPGYRLFPHGLERAYKETGDESFRTAVLLMGKNAPYAVSGGEVSSSRIRETSYLLNSYLAAERLGAPRHPMTERAVAHLLGHFSMIFDTGTYSIHQTFFDGLAAEALIGWYEATGDTRIPAAIKKMLDWHWEKGWNGVGLIYNPDPVGPTCDNTCGTFYKTELLALSMPAFGWYARVSGDTSYRDKGDVMWSHMHDTGITYSGKIFSQNYKWTPQYLAWR